nr:hypothetical protein [Tanacetum cinerariifolium]
MIKDHEIGTCDMVIVYCIMKEMSILNGRKSVHRIVAVKGEMERKDYSVLILKRDLITLKIVPRLRSSGPSSAFKVIRRETICDRIYIFLKDDTRELIIVLGISIFGAAAGEHSIQYKEYLKNSSNEIAPILPTEEPEYSLSMGDEHLSIILETESDEVIKSSVENLVPIPSEFEVNSDNESECDVPVIDESFPIFTTFLNLLFDCTNDFTSSDDKLLSNEDVPMENFKIYSNPLVDVEESISPKIDPHYFNAEYDLIESLLNQDTLIDSSPKFDLLLKEFSGELAHIDPIPSGIKEADFDLEEEIRLVENLLYDNSSPRPPEELNAEIADTIVESFSPSPIPIEDSDSQMDDIDLFLDTDDLMPPGIKNDDYDSEGNIHFLKELLSNDTLPLPEIESSNFDHHDDPSFPRPPLEPPDVEVLFYFKPDTGILIAKVVEDISEHYVLMPNVLPSQPALCLNIDTLLPFSSENKDKVFKPGILFYLLVSHRDKTISSFSKSPMMMYRADNPLLDVPYLHFYPP